MWGGVCNDVIGNRYLDHCEMGQVGLVVGGWQGGWPGDPGASCDCVRWGVGREGSMGLRW